MGKQTSRMYGIAVKERVNYYEFGTDEGFITLYYDESISRWSVVAGKHERYSAGHVEWWMGGRQYEQGEELFHFNDGDKVEYTFMETHTDTIPYKNYLYDIYGSATENTIYGTSDISYRITPIQGQNYACRVYKIENGLVASQKDVTSESIRRYKQKYSWLSEDVKMPVYGMLFDWHGMNPESGHLQMSFEAIANNNYIIYNGRHFSKNETIREWQAETFSENFEVIDESNKHKAESIGKDQIPGVFMCKRLGGFNVASAQKNKETIFSDVMYDHKDAYYNGYYHNAMFLVYDNPNVPNCWQKKSGVKINGKSSQSLAITYASPFWFLMTLKNNIEYNGRVYESRKLLKTWKGDETVDLTLKQVTSRKKASTKIGDYSTTVYKVTSDPSSETITVVSRIQNVGEKNRITSGESFTFENIDVNKSVNDWSIFSKYGHISFNDVNFGKGARIVTFGLNQMVDFELIDNTDKFNKEQELKANYEGIVYDIVAQPDSEYVTATKQLVTYEIDPETEEAEKVYTNVDSRTFHESESPVDFYNIRFTYNASINKWTIYSKCGYISYSNRLYPKGRSVLSFGTDEYDPEEEHPEIHLEIADETNQYEVEMSTTYYIKTPADDVVANYEVHTSGITGAMKVVKTIGENEEPWITVYYYDAMYTPFECYDIAFKFSAASREWSLYANSDNLYYNGTNYLKGDLLATWRYDQIVKIFGIVVTHDNLDALSIRAITKTTDKLIDNKDLDEIIGWYDEEDPDFKLSFSFAKGLWTITAICACYSDGVLYTKGQVIRSFKTKVNMETFTLMFPHTVHGGWEYITYYVDVSVDVGTGVTTLELDSPGHRSMSYNDKDISKGDDTITVFTKQDANSLYGYIWQKMPPSPPPTVMWATLIPITFSQGVLGYSSGIKGIAQMRDRIAWLPYKEHLSAPEEFIYLGHFGTYDYYTTLTGTIPQIYHTHDYGDDWDIVDLPSGVTVVMMGEFQKLVCTDSSNNFQVYTVDAYRATRTINNDISGILDSEWINKDKHYYGNNRVIFYGNSDSIFSYSPELNTILVDYSDQILADVQEEKSTYNWSRFVPPDYIESQQIYGFEGVGKQIFIHNSLYIFYKHIYVKWTKGSMSDPEDHEERIVADWGGCYYKVGSNSFTDDIVKNAAFSEEDYDNYINNTPIAQYYVNSNIYLIYYDGDITKIVLFDPEEVSFALIKTITSQSFITIRLLTGYDEYTNCTAYFDNRPFSEDDQEIGIGSPYGGETAGRDFYIYKKIPIPDSNPQRNIIVALNNVLGNSSVNNFMFKEDLLFNGD
ncbi:MAG: hypothetical protein J6Y02_19140 [Pseudobutyrivibrio sp.]|nr:hypothetical protein [Pseudobutyrivibrio sp.]